MVHRLVPTDRTKQTNKQTNKPCTLVSFAVSRLFSFAVVNVDEMVF